MEVQAMHPVKLELINSVLNETKFLCNMDHKDLNASTQAVLRLTDEQLYELIYKIMLSVPDKLIYLSDKNQVNYYVKLIASEFVLFQVNEDVMDLDYPVCFSNFIVELNGTLVSDRGTRTNKTTIGNKI